MRLLLINYEFPPLGGGGATATAALAREFAGLGIEVDVLTSSFRGLPSRERRDGFTIRRVPTLRRQANRSNIVEMSVFMASAALHVLAHSHDRPHATLAFFGIPGGPVAWWLKALRDIPYIISLRGGDVPGHQAGQLDWHHRLTKPIIKLVWRGAAAVVANSTGLRQQALQTEPNLSIPVIPNGVDAEFFSPSPPVLRSFSEGGSTPMSSVSSTVASAKVEALAKEDRLSPIRLLFVGRLSAEKGLASLLDALNGLRDESWSLEIVGDGPACDDLHAQVTRLGLGARVTFAGWVAREQIVERYRAADVFVFPSTDEGMPNTVLEAMACGLPVIACRIAGCEDLVEDGRTGLLVPPANTAELMEALRRLCGDGELRSQLAQAARARVLASFTWRRAAEAYLELMRSMSSSHA